MYLSQPFPSFDGHRCPTRTRRRATSTLPDHGAGREPARLRRRTGTSPSSTNCRSETVLEVAYVGNKGTRLWGGRIVFGEMNGLPSSMLAMGDILNEPVCDHPQYMPLRGVPAGDYTVAQALRPYPQYYLDAGGVPVQHQLELQLAADHGDAPPDHGPRLPGRLHLVQDAGLRRRRRRRQLLRRRAGLLQPRARALDRDLQLPAAISS